MTTDGARNIPEGYILCGKTIVAGSRGLVSVDSTVVWNLFDWLKLWPTEIVSGGAIGVDLAGEDFAKRYNIPIKQFIPDWERNGRGAGMQRNAEMALYADLLLAFWDGYSNGTRNMIRNMVLRNKPFHVELMLKDRSMVLV